jgi:molybdenum cofactor synthesis domain-containing protein
LLVSSRVAASGPLLDLGGLSFGVRRGQLFHLAETRVNELAASPPAGMALGPHQALILMREAQGTERMSTEERITAAILVIGDEILSGRTKDKNIGYIADHLTAIGIDLREVRVVADVEDDIVAAVNALRARCTYVFTTGGIGPTHDDITADAIARAFSVGIDHHPQVKQVLIDNFQRRGVEVTEARLRMARIPDGAEIIENRVSVAPGFKLGNVIVMAGIPAVMHVMLDAVTPRLKTGRKMLSVEIELLRGEGEIAELLGETQREYADVSMGSYPFNREARVFGTVLVLRSTDPDRLAAAEKRLKERLAAKGIPF